MMCCWTLYNTYISSDGGGGHLKRVLFIYIQRVSIITAPSIYIYNTTVESSSDILFEYHIVLAINRSYIRPRKHPLNITERERGDSFSYFAQLLAGIQDIFFLLCKNDADGEKWKAFLYTLYLYMLTVLYYNRQGLFFCTRHIIYNPFTIRSSLLTDFFFESSILFLFQLPLYFFGVYIIYIYIYWMYIMYTLVMLCIKVALHLLP